MVANNWDIDLQYHFKDLLEKENQADGKWFPGRRETARASDELNAADMRRLARKTETDKLAQAQLMARQAQGAFNQGQQAAGEVADAAALLLLSRGRCKPKPKYVYRTGSQTEKSLTDPTGVSARRSISSSADGRQKFQPGEKLYAIDTDKLPRGRDSVRMDNDPDGHVSIDATPDEIKKAIVPHGPDNPINDLGLKPQEDGSSYRIPKN